MKRNTPQYHTIQYLIVRYTAAVVEQCLKENNVEIKPYGFADDMMKILGLANIKKYLK